MKPLIPFFLQCVLVFTLVFYVLSAKHYAKRPPKDRSESAEQLLDPSSSDESLDDDPDLFKRTTDQSSDEPSPSPEGAKSVAKKGWLAKNLDRMRNISKKRPPLPMGPDIACGLVKILKTGKKGSIKDIPIADKENSEYGSIAAGLRTIFKWTLHWSSKTNKERLAAPNAVKLALDSERSNSLREPFTRVGLAMKGIPPVKISKRFKVISWNDALATLLLELELPQPQFSGGLQAVQAPQQDRVSSSRLHNFVKSVGDSILFGKGDKESVATEEDFVDPADKVLDVVESKHFDLYDSDFPVVFMPSSGPRPCLHRVPDSALAIAMAYRVGIIRVDSWRYKHGGAECYKSNPGTALEIARIDAKIIARTRKVVKNLANHQMISGLYEQQLVAKIMSETVQNRSTKLSLMYALFYREPLNVLSTITTAEPEHILDAFVEKLASKKISTDIRKLALDLLKQMKTIVTANEETKPECAYNARMLAK